MNLYTVRINVNGVYKIEVRAAAISKAHAIKRVADRVPFEMGDLLKDLAERNGRTLVSALKPGAWVSCDCLVYNPDRWAANVWNAAEQKKLKDLDGCSLSLMMREALGYKPLKRRLAMVGHRICEVIS